MLLKAKFIPLLLLAACGRALPERPAASAALAAKYDTYVHLSPKPENAFTEDCDGLLFKSLLAAASGREFVVESHRDETGAWFRHVDHQRCNPTSRDMYLGLFYFMWAFDRDDLVEQVWRRGVNNSWVMDARKPSISYMLPDSVATLGLLRDTLQGKDTSVWTFPVPCVGSLGGFEGHLQSLVLGMRALLGINDILARSCAAEMVRRHPTNAWFQAVHGLYTGDQSETEALLLSERLWPNDRLPTSADYCEQWVTQRDDNENWQPCPEEGRTHTGGDFMLAAAVVLGKL